jgi:2-C-methyl-D-erythritol 4-phosphate cytidylyltransferase
MQNVWAVSDYEEVEIRKVSEIQDGKHDKKRPFCSAVIVAAGRGERMGGINKLLAPLHGLPVLAYTLIAFENSPLIDEMVVVSREDEMGVIAGIVKECALRKVIKIIQGGARRQDSVYAGIMAISRSAKLAAVHDGARPLVTAQVISEAVEGAIHYGCAAPAVPVKDTLKIVENGIAVSTPDRSKFFAVQTPQVFEADVLKAALTDAMRAGMELTDDCMAVERLGLKVKMTAGSEENIKITTPADLIAAEAILISRNASCGVQE